MAVMIEGMEMPNDCKKCPLMATDGRRDMLSPMMCIAIWAVKHEIKHCIGGTVRDDCPLKEIITCKECDNRCTGGYCTKHDIQTRAGFYCADAERK